MLICKKISRLLHSKLLRIELSNRKWPFLRPIFEKFDASISIYNLEYNPICKPSFKFSTYFNIWVNHTVRSLEVEWLSIILVIIVNNSCSMNREYDNFYGVNVYLWNNRISLLHSNVKVKYTSGNKWNLARSCYIN